MSLENNKYYLQCRECKHEISGLKEWFESRQKCPECGNKWVDAKYHDDAEKIRDLILNNSGDPNSVFYYFDFLPILDEENIITRGEGVIPVENWTFLEQFAKEKYNLDITVNVYRNDLNQGTNTFKDVAASVAASALKENGINQYAVASTGNIASAFSHYLALADINLSVFMPNDALKANESEVSAYGQQVFRVNGDYAAAKKVAADYSSKYNILLSGGNTDPMRVEAKKTMVFEWLRQTGELPGVYIQALSGGTGPIAIEKGCDEIQELGLFDKRPRYIMVQPDGCDPMTAGWNDAKAKGFPEGWEKVYPIYENPTTAVPTLATGNPATFPIIASIVKQSGGEIITTKESETADIARLVVFEKGVKIGPASTVAVNGFFEALKQDLIKDGENVLINIGESMNRAPELLSEMIYTTKLVDSVNDCTPPDRETYRKLLWNKFA
jgi:threonine synthase